MGKGVFGGIRKVGSLGSGQHDRSPSNGSTADIPPVPAVPAYATDAVVSPAGSPNGRVRESSAPTNGGGPFAGAPGQLSVRIHTLTGAGEEDEKKAVTLKLNGKAVDTTHALKGDPATFDEAFTVKTSEGPCLLDFHVFHKKSFGKDTAIAEASVSLWEHITALTSPNTTVTLPLSPGELTVDLSVRLHSS